MNVIDAAYRIGQDYPGGAEALALRMGRPNLSDELNPGRAGAKLGVKDAVEMQVLSGDFRVLLAMAAECGFLCVPLPSTGGPGQVVSAESVAQLAQEFADLMGSAVTAFADDKITGTELRQLELHSGHLVASLQSLLRQAVELHRMAQPVQSGGVA